MRYRKLVLILCTVLMFVFCPSAKARAGGKTSTGSSGSSHTTSSKTGSGSSQNQPAVTIITIFTALGAFGFLSYYTHAYQVTKVRKYFKPALKQLKSTLPYDLDSSVIDLYYIVQNAWKNQDIVILNEHLDPELANQWAMKLSWMALNHQHNVMRMIQLICIYPFAIINDHVFYYIRGMMIDYIEDTDTAEIIEGLKTPQPFTEFWEIEIMANGVHLYRIYQLDELSASDFEPYI